MVLLSIKNYASIIGKLVGGLTDEMARMLQFPILPLRPGNQSNNFVLIDRMYLCLTIYCPSENLVL